MNEYLSPLKASQLTKWSERTWRDKCARDVIPGAHKVGKQWLIPRDALRLCGILRGPEKEQGEPQMLAPDSDLDIVIATEDDRRGIYIDHTWFGAQEALGILEYLQKHEQWIREKE